MLKKVIAVGALLILGGVHPLMLMWLMRWQRVALQASIVKRLTLK